MVIFLYDLLILITLINLLLILLKPVFANLLMKDWTEKYNKFTKDRKRERKMNYFYIFLKAIIFWNIFFYHWLYDIIWWKRLWAISYIQHILNNEHICFDWKRRYFNLVRMYKISGNSLSIARSIRIYICIRIWKYFWSNQSCISLVTF